MKSNFFLFSILFALIFSAARCQRFCNGVYCDASCQNCYPCVQEVNCMKASNCYCASKSIPGGLSLADTPQFFFLTFDDAISTHWYTEVLQELNYILKNPSIVDSAGCFPKPSLYFMSDTSDFNMANYISKIGFIGYHTQTHTTSMNSPADVWATELLTQQKQLNQLAKIPHVKGSRAPYLQVNDAYFAQLQSMGVVLDSSFVYGWDHNNPAQAHSYWPFTLDYGVPDPLMCMYFGNCPTAPHKGIWELPLQSFFDNSYIQDYDVTDYAGTMAKMKANFLASYNFNKVPRGYHIHFRYLAPGFQTIDQARKNFMVEFFTWLTTTFNDIIFTTEDKVVSWIKNPTNTANTRRLPDFQCSDPNLTHMNSCPYGVSTCYYKQIPKKVCGRKCPQPFPSLGVQWDYKQTNRNIPHWTGNVIVEVSDSWSSGFCGSFTMQHSNDSNAASFIMSATTLVSTGSITAMWGFVQHSMNLDNTAIIYRQSGFDLSVPKNTATNIGGMCMQLVPGTYYDGWIEKNLRFGIDLYEQALTCPLEGCKIFCGDGRCDSSEGENATNCPFDCKPFAVTGRRLLWDRYF